MKKEQVFNLTVKFIRDCFHEFNVEYFHGTLMEPEFTIKTLKNTLGQFRWKTADDGKKKFTIMVSDYFLLSEHDYCQIILHEMIHLFIRQNNLTDTRVHHGKLFYQYADFINGDGWDIRRTMSTKGFAVRQEALETYSLVMFRLRDGRPFLMRYNAKYRDYYARLFAKSPTRYVGTVWFTSDDSARYASMTKCHTAVRGRYLTEAEYSRLNSLHGGYGVAV